MNAHLSSFDAFRLNLDVSEGGSDFFLASGFCKFLLFIEGGGGLILVGVALGLLNSFFGVCSFLICWLTLVGVLLVTEAATDVVVVEVAVVVDIDVVGGG